MKRLIIAALLLPLTCYAASNNFLGKEDPAYVLGKANAAIASVAGVTFTQASTAVTRTDDFNRASVNPIAGNWTTVSGMYAVLLGGDAFVSGTDSAGDFAAYWNADSFTANQFSAVEVTGNHGGVVVRVNGASCYMFKRTTSGTFQMWKWASGWTQLGADYTGVSFSDGQIVRLEATGTSTTTLTPIVNGVTLATREDSSSAIESGGVGVYCGGNSGVVTLDDWAGGGL